MESFRRPGTGVLLFLVFLAICVVSSASAVKFLPPPNSARQPSTVVHHQGNGGKHVFSQADRRIRIAVFTFNILNLGAAGYDATISNLFMTLLDQHQIFEVMSRKDLEDSLRRDGLQQSEDVSVVQTVGVRLGLDGIILGNVQKTGSSIEFEVKFVEISRGHTLLQRTEQVFGFAALRQKVEEITREIVQIAEQYQPSPVIVQKEEVSLHPAQPEGLQARGVPKKLFSPGNQIRSPTFEATKCTEGPHPWDPFPKLRV